MNARIDMDSLLAELNPEQHSAVTHLSGPLLVLAGAGTGKTRVITLRIANLLSYGVDASSIVAVSFTKKAGNEMKERLSGLIGTAANAMQVSTFHSLGLSIIRENHNELGLIRGFQVCNEQHRLKIAEQILRDVEQPNGGDYIEDAGEMLRDISMAKTVGSDVAELRASSSLFDVFMGNALAAYNNALHAGGKFIDMDDMIELPVLLLEREAAIRNRYRERYSHLMADEFQDSSSLQYRLLKCLLGSQQDLCVVGDDDQSIYQFRGARRELILGFGDEFPGAKIVKLTRNYRCSQQIINVANEVIQDAPGRYDKHLVAVNGSAKNVRFLETSTPEHERNVIADDMRRIREQEQRPYSDFAVLARVSKDVRAMKRILGDRGVPCNTESNGVSLMTLHASKGLEFPVVYLVGVEEDSLPHWNSKNSGQAAIDEERRLFYVGVTRAKQQLTMSSANRHGKHTRSPSRFASGLIQKRLVEHQTLTN